MNFTTQTFLVFGLSTSGNFAAQKLLDLGAKTLIYDDDNSEKTERIRNELVSRGAIIAQDISNAIERSDVIVVSPGVRIDHPALISAKRRAKRIMGELELGFLFTRAPIIAVTGTNGKTTTCSLIAAMLAEGGIENSVLGNYGVPLTVNGEKLSERGVAVVEVSSFQLETIKAFCPHIAVVLNVRSDHLDRHYTRENYVYLKSRILSNLRESEYSILNFDDETARSFGAGQKSKVVWFSRKEKVGGAYIEDGTAYFFDEPIFAMESLKIAGDHNEENVLAAICAARLSGVSAAAISRALENFGGVRHRMEKVDEIGGVEFINDSKATNVDSTLKAVESMTKPTVIILGGKDKKQDYSSLFENLKNSKVKHAVLTGEEAFNLYSAANAAGFKDISLCSDFDAAVKLASFIAKKGDVVLLSPATSSFDRFKSFEERGAEFERVVKALN